MRWVAGMLAAAFVMAAGMGGAQAPPVKLALVIGNAAYTTPGWALTNPVNDANLVAQRLRPLGFDVTLVPNATKAQMETAMGAFAAKLRAGGSNVVGLFYYAGHGVELDGANLLVPVDVTARSLDELRYQAPPMNFLLRDMARLGNDVNIVVLDACRNVPLPSGTRTGPAGGLSQDELSDVPANVFIAYATRPGQVAYDNEGESNSIFTRTLAEALSSSPSERIETLFGQVQSRVFRATGEVQRPEYRNGLLRAPEFRFAPPAPTPVSAPNASATTSVAPRAPTTPGTIFRDCGNCPEMVVLPAGTFLMGSPADEAGRDSDEGPQRRVTIARPFAVGKFEITFAEWDQCPAAGGCVPPEESAYRPEARWGRGRMPVVLVSWQDAKRYVRWLNEKVGGSSYRLLTEAEWEYAARARTTTAYITGNSVNPSQAHYRHIETFDGTVTGLRPDQSAPVGSFPPNAFKLHDMDGNVSELVEDCYSQSYEGLSTDGSANTTIGCGYRVGRGGSFFGSSTLLRPAQRQESYPYERSLGTGFRVARSLP